ncbi:MAG: DivIVA domain-containing protein [Lachnospiraceae bacterium]|nr:DivIVA domain-containing protein [Lachnospiraceae bacterium]MBP3507135.1 DivIVA domain-containing protein [Lachnospiraceae bacterium]
MITPVEIQSKAFKSGIGYDKKDVDGFINEILENYEELYRSNVEMKDKINMLNEGLQHYKNIEASLQKALVLAEKTSEETIRTAELKAQTIEMEAVNKAKEHTADAKLELERVHNQTVALVQQYTKYKAQFTQFLNAQLDLISSDSFRMDANDFAAFTKTAASANDAYMNSNPMSDFMSGGEQQPLSGFDNGEDSGRLGERDDSDRYNMDYNQGSGLNNSSTSFVDPFETVKKREEAAPTQEPEPEVAEELDTFEGEVEDKVEKRAMLGDEDANSTGFTFI